MKYQFKEAADMYLKIK